MRGIVIHCANIECKKLLLKDAVIVPGSEFKTNCYYCGHLIRISADYKRIILLDMDKNKNTDKQELHDDDDSGIVFLGG